MVSNRMPLKRSLMLLTIGISLFFKATNLHASEKPNIIIILADDLGWGDVGFNGCTDIPTPHLDKLANSGIIFSIGYATHPYCSPSRAGLLTGKYQQSFGHENNDQKQVSHEPMGLPLEEKLISNVLKENGYQTCAIGKWHLGDSSIFWPISRGFDNWFGFSGGSRNYWGNSSNIRPEHKIYRDGVAEPLKKLSYLTDDFTDAAINYIEDYSKSEKPFFMYLAYNAPHAPIQATREYLFKTEHIEDGKRAAYSAMVVGMDVGIGKVIEKLKATGEYENTLIIFYSDNGGHAHGANNTPYRGMKGMLFEGGIRVPFCMSWPKNLKGGNTYEKPVIALDIFPTILSAANINYQNSADLDGVDLFPFLKNNMNKQPHDKLFWRYSDGMGYAVRKGDFKLVKDAVRDDIFLFNMKDDPLEHNNLARQMPEKFKELQNDYNSWNTGNINGLWHDKHPENVMKTKEAREKIIKKTCSGETQ